MAEVASAFVSLMPSARNFGRDTVKQVGGQVKTAGTGLGRTMGRSLFGAAAAIGAAMGVSRLFSDSLGEAREAQKVAALTAQVIKTTGGAAKVTAKQVESLSGAISKKTGIDDEAIQSGANLILTFKNIKREGDGLDDIFGRATKAAVDLSAAGFGDMTSTAKQLGKALNDPIKGITAMTRSGVTFTEQQKEQIKTLVESGKTLEAQKIILKEVESQVGGAAAATATAGDKAKVALGNLKETIGTALLPAIDTVSRAFTKKIAPALTTFVENIGPAIRKTRDFFTAGEGAPILATAMGAIATAVGGIRDGLGIAADNFGRLKDGVEGLDLGDFDGKQVGEALGKAVLDGIKFLARSTSQIGAAIADVFGRVDWVGLGITIGRQAPALLLGLAAGILAFDFGSLLQGIANNWGTILIAVLAIAFAPAKIAAGLAKILARIPFVGRFLSQAVKWLNDLGGRLAKFGGDLFRTFAQGFGRVRFPGAGLISRVMGAFRQLPGHIADFFRTLQVRIGVWALDAFGAAGRGARTAVGRLASFAGTIPGRIVRAVGSLAGVLYNAGRSLISGLISGIMSKLGDLASAMGSVASKVKGFLPGSPVKEGPLTSWNNGAAGKRLVDLLAIGLSDTTSVDAAMSRLTSRVNLAAPTLTAGNVATGTAPSSPVDLEQSSYRAFTRALADTRTVIMSKPDVEALDLLVGAG